MSMLCGLAAFALKSVTGLEADGLARWAAERFADHTRGVPKALSEAHGRAWLALSLALADDGLWGRMTDLGRDGDLKAIRDLARGLITAAHPPNFRAACLGEYNALSKAGRLALPPLPADPTALVAHPALAMRSVDDALVGMARELEKDAPNLASAALLKPPGGVPLFASAFLFFFRREMEKDAETARGLTLDKLDLLAGDQQRGFDALGEVLRLNFNRVQEALRQMGDELRDELQSCRDEMRQLREALRVQPSPAEAPIAVSANTEAERMRLRHLRDRLRTLPSDAADANVMAALFDATGEYKEAMAAHRESARLAKARADRAAEAEAHYKAFRDACELQDWAAAKESLGLAVRLDGPRFRPFETGRYEMVRVLGAGGFGTVFECLDHYEHGDDGTPVRVAVKSLRAEGLERGPAEVFREAKVLKQLGQSGGSRVIGVSHWGHAVPDPDRPGAGRGPFIVMDYFDGETLEALVKRDGPLAVPDLLAIARQMAEALRDAHGRNVLHRDLKPGNVMARRVGPAWDVRVIDFGLAVRHEAQAMAGQAMLSTARGRSLTGSIDFAPPEQKGRLPGMQPGPYSDVYAWGKTCQWLLFKTTEVRGPHWKRLPEDVRGPIQVLLEAATMEELPDRVKDFGEVLKALDGIEGRSSEPARPLVEKATTLKADTKVARVPRGILQSSLQLRKISERPLASIVFGAERRATIGRIQRVNTKNGYGNATYVSIGNGTQVWFLNVTWADERGGAVKWLSTPVFERDGATMTSVCGAAYAWLEGGKVWTKATKDAPAREVPLQLPGPPTMVAIHDSPGRLAVTADKRLHLFDLATLELLGSADVPNSYTGSDFDRLWFGDRARLATAKYASQVLYDGSDLRKLLDLENLGLRAHFVSHSNAFDPSGRYYATCAAPQNVAVFDTDEGYRPVTNLSLPGESLGSAVDMAFHPSYENVLFCVNGGYRVTDHRRSGEVSFCNLADRTVTTLVGPERLWVLCFFGGNDLFVTIDEGHHCVAWRIEQVPR